jgi:predicted dehydrogenase
MNRRTFLLSSAGASLASGQRRIRIGVLGAAHPHASAKIQLLKNSPNFELVGVWEEDAKIRTTLEGTGVRLLTRDQILGDSSIPVVAVESGVKTHAEQARMALEAGKHVHIEKPPAYRRGDLEKLVEIARRKKLTMQMGYMWRYHPGINAALEAAHKGWLGDVYLIRGTINTIGNQSQREEWNMFPGGHMFELAGHLIDPLVRLGGKPLRVTPFLRSHGPYADKLVDNAVAVFEFPKALGVITGTALQPGAGAHRSFEIFGYNGTAVLRPIEPGALEIQLQKEAGPYKAGINKVALPPYQRYAADFDALSEALRTGKALPVSFDEELAVQEGLLRASGMWT